MTSDKKNLMTTAKRQGGYDYVENRIKKSWLEAKSKSNSSVAKRAKSMLQKENGGPIAPSELYNGIMSLKPGLEKDFAMKLARQISQASYDNNIDPYSMTAQMFQESGFNPDAVSRAGATGIAQLMPETSKRYGVDPRNVEDSVRVMGDYMASNRLKNRRDGLPDDEATAQMRYNAGGPNLKKWMKSGNIAKETKEYPERIASHRKKAFGDAVMPDYLYLGGIDENDPRIDEYAVTAKRMKQGGKIKKYQDGGMIQYDAPTHEQGGQMVDQMGNPTGNPQQMAAEIEKSEVALKDSKFSQPYVMSDHLINPSTGNTYAKDASRMMKKMKGNDPISMNGRKLVAELLKKSNDASRKEYGGKILRAGGWPGLDQLTNVANSASAFMLGEEEEPAQQLPEFYAKRQQDFNSLITNPSQQPADYASSYNNPGSANVPDPAGGNEYTQEPTQTGPTTADLIKWAKAKGVDFSDPMKMAMQLGAAATQIPLGQGTGDQQTSGASSLLPLLGGAGLKSGAGILSAAMALQPAEKEKLQMPNFSAGDQAFADMGIDTQALKNEIMGAYGANKLAAQESSRSFGQYMNRTRAGATAAGRELAKAEMDAKAYNDRVSAMVGQREDTKATVAAGEQIRKQTADSQNVAMRQDQIQNVLNKADRFGTEMMANDVLEKETQNLNEAERKQFIIDMAAMEMKYPDFELNEELRVLLADPDSSWEQLRDAMAKSLVTWRGTRMGSLEAKKQETDTDDGTE